MDSEHPELLRVLTESARRGFLGPGPVAAHLLHAQGFAHGLPMGAATSKLALLDLGSGGGLPGLPLFTWRGDLVGVLLDGMERRTRFLQEAIRDLAIDDRVSVCTSRAEDAILDPALSGGFDIVTARSFGPPSATLELAGHFLGGEGIVLISEPPGGRRWDRSGLESLGLEQISPVGAAIARFRRCNPPPPPRRWKHIIDSPAVAVSAIETTR